MKTNKTNAKIARAGKKLVAASLALACANAFAYSEAKKLTKLSAEDNVSEASYRGSYQAVYFGISTQSPALAALLYVFITEDGPGFNADLDFITYHEKYGVLHNSTRAADYGTNEYGSSIEKSKSATESVKGNIVKAAQKIVDESDNFYADDKLSPAKTPELLRNAKAYSELSGMGLKESAEEVIIGSERILADNI